MRFRKTARRNCVTEQYLSKWANGAYVCGNPDQVAEVLIRMIEDLWLDRLCCTLPLGSMPHDQVLRAIELFERKSHQKCVLTLPWKKGYKNPWRRNFTGHLFDGGKTYFGLLLHAVLFVTARQFELLFDCFRAFPWQLQVQLTNYREVIEVISGWSWLVPKGPGNKQPVQGRHLFWDGLGRDF